MDAEGKPSWAHVRIAVGTFVFVAGCLVAASQEPLYDTLYLKSGAQVEGKVLEARDGRYWVQLVDGRVRSYPYADVERVFEAPDDLRAPISVALEPSPEPSADRREQKTRLVGGGIDLGLVTAGRLRFRLDNPVVHSVDLRGGYATTFLFSGFSSFYPAPALFVGPEVVFLGDSPVHPTIGLKTGVALYSSPYVWVSTGAGVRFDIGRHFGLQVGTDLGFVVPSYFTLAPDAGVSFMW